MKFLLLPRRIGLEADLPMKVDVPTNVEKLYKEKYSDKLVAWLDKNTDKCGCIYLNRSATADLSKTRLISIYEIKPAKGWGHVGSTLKCAQGEVLATLFSSRYSEQSLEWLETTQKKLASFFDIETEYESLGYDA